MGHNTATYYEVMNHDFDPEYDAEPVPPPLPSLSNTPTVYPDCCLALSAPLLAHLSSLLPPAPALTLSIGSGYGLLEALLLSPPHNLHVVGVEVRPSPNTYLASAHHRAVPGSRFLEPLAGEAEAWVFVYPRRVGLVAEYLRMHGGETVSVESKSNSHQARARRRQPRVKTMIWIGPTADWEDYKGCFKGWAVEVKSADGVGGRAWEIIAVARRKTADTSHLEDPS